MVPHWIIRKKCAFEKIIFLGGLPGFIKQYKRVFCINYLATKIYRQERKTLTLYSIDILCQLALILQLLEIGNIELEYKDL
jgi:uncharacterized protein YqkB